MQTPAEKDVYAALCDATFRAMQQAVIYLPPDVKRAISHAVSRESDAVAQGELANIAKNIGEAERLGIPLCQDTGVPVVYLTIPPTIPFSEMLFRAIAAGIRRATEEVPLRPNVVDPLTRKNSKDNTGAGMPAIHVKPGNRFTVTVLPKGAGAENVSRIVMLLPSEQDEIEKFIVETMLIAEGKPCPPVVLGVGIGGTFDGVAALAKEAKKRKTRGTPFAGPNCAMRMTDLGIAIGSAVKTAQIHNVDNRIMYSAGTAAVELGLLGKTCTVAYAIPLSARGKNMFFDRQV